MFAFFKVWQIFLNFSFPVAAGKTAAGDPI